MATELVHIGFGSVIAVNRVIAFLSINQQPIKRLLREVREKGLLIDATYGRRTRSVIITDSSHVLLSAIQPETVGNRFISNISSIEK